MVQLARSDPLEDLGGHLRAERRLVVNAVAPEISRGDLLASWGCIGDYGIVGVSLEEEVEEDEEEMKEDVGGNEDDGDGSDLGQGKITGAETGDDDMDKSMLAKAPEGAFVGLGVESPCPCSSGLRFKECMQSSIGVWQTSERSSHRERICELDTQVLIAVL